MGSWQCIAILALCVAVLIQSSQFRVFPLLKIQPFDDITLDFNQTAHTLRNGLAWLAGGLNQSRVRVVDKLDEIRTSAYVQQAKEAAATTLNKAREAGESAVEFSLERLQKAKKYLIKQK